MSVSGDLQYLPLGQPHLSLLTAIYFVLVAWILVRAFRLASTRVGLGASTALILLAASLAATTSTFQWRSYLSSTLFPGR